MIEINTILWIITAFLAGSLPFSVWVGRLGLRRDIRQYGDQNPGATNVARAGGVKWGVLALTLDVLKGAIPVSLAWFWAGIDGWGLLPIALAPILGHAYSPLLGFRGGKALAVSLGVWGGLTAGEAPLVLVVLFLIWYAAVSVDGWAAILGALSFFGYLLVADKTTLLLAIWAGNFLILAWKHRHDLVQVPRPRAWLRGNSG